MIFLHRTLQERQLQALEFYLLRFTLKQLSELLGARSHLRGIFDTAEDDIFQLMLTHHLDVTLTTFPFWYLSTICSIHRKKSIIYCITGLISRNSRACLRGCMLHGFKLGLSWVSRYHTAALSYRELVGWLKTYTKLKLRNFLRKKSWPSHFPEWINA